MSWFVIAMQVGMWFGYISFGYIADAVGRKRTYVSFVLMASVLLPLYGYLREPVLLLLLGPFVAFFGTGYYSGFGAVIAELYPTSVRATAAGVGYNVGPHRQRRGAVRGGLDGRLARLRRGVCHHRRGVLPGGARLDRHSRHAEQGTDVVARPERPPWHQWPSCPRRPSSTPSRPSASAAWPC